MKTRVYIAASFARREEARSLASAIAGERYEICARWLDPAQQNHVQYGMDPRWAKMDLEDVSRCDVMVHICDGPGKQQTRGGRHTEFGVALVLRKQILLVGEPEQVFHNHPSIWCRVDDIPAALEVLFDSGI